jgi:hypothetical protein
MQRDLASSAECNNEAKQDVNWDTRRSLGGKQAPPLLQSIAILGKCPISGTGGSGHPGCIVEEMHKAMSWAIRYQNKFQL